MGRRARAPARPGGSGPYVAVTSSRSAIARSAAVVERLKTSTGEDGSAMGVDPSTGESDQRRLDPGLLELGAEAALVILRHGRALEFIALVEEGDPEGEREVVEDPRVLGPGDHGARRHHRRDVAVDEAGAREIGERHHGADGAPTLLAVPARRFR